jgi:EmrB/QacA subfamily drug resistance transporter
MLRVTDENRKWWTLFAIAFSLFVINLDNTVVVVAIPSIRQDLDMPFTQLEWIVNAYTLVFAVLLLFGGKLADLLGRRRILLVGLVVFEISSVVCALSPDGAVLIGARAVQGVGAALMLPATLALVSANFAPAERGMAFGIWAGLSALALAVGPVIGGLLVDGINWRWIFYINVPIGLVGFIAVRVIVRESKDESGGRELDLSGLIVGALATFALVFALTEANRYGWGSLTILALLATSVVGLVAFVLIELRSRAALLDLSVFRDTTFSGANFVGLTIMLALFGALIYLSVFAQDVLFWTPLRAGAVFMPLTILLMLTAPIGGKLSDEMGPGGPMAIGMALFGSGLLLLSRLGLDWGFWDLLPGFALAGIGFGLTMPASTTAALDRVPVDKTGVASGVLNTFRQLGGALGIAIVGAIVAGSVGDQLPGDPGFGSAFITGTHNGLLVVGIIALVGAAVAALTIKQPLHHQHGEAADEPPLPEIPPLGTSAPAQP